jgi:hypothetical protein
MSTPCSPLASQPPSSCLVKRIVASWEIVKLRAADGTRCTATKNTTVMITGMALSSSVSKAAAPDDLFQLG